MFELKKLSKEAISRSLAKAERYRLLNEPGVAESICQDILNAERENQDALVMMILAITDQYATSPVARFKESMKLVSRLKDKYQRAYYSGICSERLAKAKLRQGYPGAEFDAYEVLQEALKWFELAEEVRPSGNEDAILRWNNCARIMINKNLRSRPEEETTPISTDFA
jgi:hypothetical protein